MVRMSKQSLCSYYNSEELWDRGRLSKLHSFKRWSAGFACPRCRHDRTNLSKPENYFSAGPAVTKPQRRQVQSYTNQKLPLTTWFYAIYLVAHAKRGKSALSLSQLLGINYRTALQLLRKSARRCMNVTKTT